MKRYVQVGCGCRGVKAYAIPLVKEYSDYGKLCGVYDINPLRAKLVSELVGKPIPVFESFEEMLSKTKPDTVIVTSVDCFHDQYVVASIEAGCDVICEKPITTTLEKAMAIYEAQKRTGKKVTVTFNLRFHPFFVKLKELVQSGVLGDVLSVHYEWMLGITHGSAYFHRWHAEQAKSGSLLVHKSTHHFDIVNWLLDQRPISVNAFGTRRVFGDAGEMKSERCLTCTERCPYYFDINADEMNRRQYLECEEADGYLRDSCVYSKRVDIQDTVSVNALYDGGTVMSYTLSAFSPYEGMRLVLNGTKGRIEADGTHNTIHLFEVGGEDVVIEVAVKDDGDHGGADYHIREHLFKGKPINLPGQSAGIREGFMSIAIGIAARNSMQEGGRVDLQKYADTLYK